ncbi:MAG TPA: FRG domain-containing protein, partial [Thermoanaerobaculia bacterium]|nr:FRG domain-containing protein [Thermoanaerobaculia bacterium]
MREGPLHTFQRREDAEDATAALVEALQDVDFIDDKTWWAPSPWHAAAWLMNETAGSAIGEETFPAPLRMRPHRRRGALLFRGQRSIAWPIIARIARTPRPDEEIAAMRRLAFALDEGYREAEAPPTTTEAHFAVAQHYGIATHLVDLTVDPRVAVFFACDGANDRDLVTVEWVDFSDADDLGLRLILAPPWVQRIYDQRGIFIDTTRVAGELTSHFRRIVFPADARFVRSEFGSRQTIYGESSWFDR